MPPLPSGVVPYGVAVSFVAQAAAAGAASSGGPKKRLEDAVGWIKGLGAAATNIAGGSSRATDTAEDPEYIKVGRAGVSGAAGFGRRRFWAPQVSIQYGICVTPTALQVSTSKLLPATPAAVKVKANKSQVFYHSTASRMWGLHRSAVQVSV
jgi:hypothetical protein